MRRLPLVFVAFSAAFVVTTGTAQAGDFVDTRLNFTITNENVLVKPGETNPSVPGWRIGAPSQLGILFFDNYDTRYTGFENLTHLVVHKVMNTSRVTAEGAYVLRLLQFTDVNLSSIDDGSYIRIQYWFDKSRVNKTNIALTAFPLSADRMRLGYSYRISWGGSPIFFKYNPDLPIGAGAFVTNTNPAPGLKLQLSGERYYAYFGFKTSLLLDRNPNVNEQVAVYGLLGGFGVDLVKEHLRLEMNGGYFDRGTNPLFFGTVVGSQGQTFTSYPVATYGGTVQLSAFWGLSPTTSLDLTLYRNDPMVSAQRYFSRPTYTPNLGFLVSAELTALGTTLQDADRPASTKAQLGMAGDVNFRLQKSYFRFRTDLEFRTLSFILVNQPSLVPYQDFAAGATVTPEIFASAGADYFFERIGLTLGLSAGVLAPSTFQPPAAQPLPQPICPNTGGSLCESARVVVRNEGDFSILPVGRSEVPVVATKLELREDFLEWFAAIVQVLYQYDANQTILAKQPDGTSGRVFSQPNRLGFNITLQARY
jgi:hypothetical protein